MKIQIDAQSKTPTYRQIVQQVAEQVRDGRLQPGDKLPSERGLAQQLGLARGTVKQAYEALVRDQMIDVSRGRGAFVSSRQDVLPEGRKERALAAIEQMIVELEGLKISDQEIRTFVDLKISERRERMRSFHVAAVDCNPECLQIFDRQLRLFQQIRLSRILLDDIYKDPEREARMGNFDLILTTSTHIRELQSLLPNLRNRLQQVAVSPSQGTIIEMAGLGPGVRPGVICHTDNFLSIIRRRLRAFDHQADPLPCLRIGNEEQLQEFLEVLDVVFVPPGYQIRGGREIMAAVQRFTWRGGRIITFDYQIERGSLLHVEERIQHMLNA